MSLLSRLMASWPRLDRNTTVHSGTLKVFSTQRDVASLPRQEDAGHGMPGHHDHARSEATLDKAVEDIRGRPRHPAKALAANHSHQVTLIHPAATEADSKNGSEAARPRTGSTPRPAGTPTMSRATVVARGRNGQHIMANPLSRRPAAWIVAAFAAMAMAITVLLGKAVTLAAPGRRAAARAPAVQREPTCSRPDGLA
jgi:hypothetical protein